MFAGKTKAALDLLSATQSGILHLDDLADPTNPESSSVRDAVKSKHPEGQLPHPEYILSSDPLDMHPVDFESLNANSIRSAAL